MSDVDASDAARTRHQVSFVIDGNDGESHLVQVDFLATSAEASDLRERLEPVLGFDANSEEHDIKDFQVYEPRGAEGGAGELVDTLMNALRHVEGIQETFKAAADLAEAIDKSLASEPLSAGDVRLLEFVWENGGGDDNAFGQCYVAPADIELRRRFERALTEALADEAYEIGFSTDSETEPLPDLQAALQELVIHLEGHGFESKAEQVTALVGPESPIPA